MFRLARFAGLSAISVGLLLLMALWFDRPGRAATGQPYDCGPAPTPEIMEVASVTSPTTALTQALRVRLGNGRAITATSEAGRVVSAGPFSSGVPASIVIPLSPNVTHHVIVTGQVEYAAYCYYTLNRAADMNGAPLTIVQMSRRVYLPIVVLKWISRQGPQVGKDVYTQIAPSLHPGYSRVAH